MKILFLVSSMHSGGAERVAASLSSAWVNAGHSVCLVPTYTGRGELFYEVDPAVQIIWLADRLRRPARGPLVPLVKLRELRRLVREMQPDVIVSFLTNVNVMALMATRGLRVPLIVCERTNPAVSGSASPLLRRLRRVLYPLADMVTVQAEASREDMLRLVPGVRCLEVVPNPLPPGLPPPKTAALHSSQGPGESPVQVGEPHERHRFRLIAMGRLVASKRFDLLIRVFSRLSSRFPEWDLWIWGEGPCRASLENLLRSCELDARVQMPGRTSQPWQEMLAADMFVMTSEVEGFPNTLLEAMALGLPCVTVDCPSGPREITRDGRDARLLPLNDEVALENALAELMGDPEARATLSASGVASVKARYGMPSVLAQWDNLFSIVRNR